MLRNFIGTSSTFEPESSSTTSDLVAGTSGVSSSAFMGGGRMGEAAGRGGSASFVRGLLGEEAVLEAPGGRGEGPGDQAGGRLGEGGKHSGRFGSQDLSPVPRCFCGESFSGEAASEDGAEGALSETAAVEAKEEFRANTPPPPPPPS
mmetsp:Transcript_103933/g.269094  ORF Transcript_103933/g.269094 Transcript_103933/m.269094 type:complete len:148 (+) Transcript_103933:629-1072(+)